MTLDPETKLKQKYMRNLPVKTAEIASDFEAGDIASLQVEIHKLAGSAGMYGFAGLSSLAAEIEDFIVSKSAVDMEILKIRLQQLYAKVDRTISEVEK